MAAFNPFHTAKVLDGLWKRSTGIRSDRGLIQGISNFAGEKPSIFFVVPIIIIIIIISSSWTTAKKHCQDSLWGTFLPQLCVAFMIIYDYDVSSFSNKQLTVKIAMLG